MNQELKKKRLL